MQEEDLLFEEARKAGLRIESFMLNPEHENGIHIAISIGQARINLITDAQREYFTGATVEKIAAKES